MAAMKKMMNSADMFGAGAATAAKLAKELQAKRIKMLKAQDAKRVQGRRDKQQKRAEKKKATAISLHEDALSVKDKEREACAVPVAETGREIRTLAQPSQIRIVVVGGGGVGKSFMLAQLTGRPFVPRTTESWSFTEHRWSAYVPYVPYVPAVTLPSPYSPHCHPLTPCTRSSPSLRSRLPLLYPQLWPLSNTHARGRRIATKPPLERYASRDLGRDVRGEEGGAGEAASAAQGVRGRILCRRRRGTVYVRHDIPGLARRASPVGPGERKASRRELRPLGCWDEGECGLQCGCRGAAGDLVEITFHKLTCMYCT